MSNGFYTVQAQDVAEGLMGISRRYDGAPEHWAVIYEANCAVIGDNPCLLRPGQQLVLPDLIPTQPAQAGACLYHMELRDCAGGLRGVAVRLWDDGERWPELHALNRGIVGDDPATLVPGQWLLLP